MSRKALRDFFSSRPLTLDIPSYVMKELDSTLKEVRESLTLDYDSALRTLDKFMEKLITVSTREVKKEESSAPSADSKLDVKSKVALLSLFYLHSIADDKLKHTICWGIKDHFVNDVLEKPVDAWNTVRGIFRSRFAEPVTPSSVIKELDSLKRGRLEDVFDLLVRVADLQAKAKEAEILLSDYALWRLVEPQLKSWEKSVLEPGVKIPDLQSKCDGSEFRKLTNFVLSKRVVFQSQATSSSISDSSTAVSSSPSPSTPSRRPPVRKNSPTRPPLPPSTSSYNLRPRSSPSEIICHNCKTPGHKRPDCPKLKGTATALVNSSGLLIVDMKVRGLPVKVALDTMSTVSMLVGERLSAMCERIPLSEPLGVRALDGPVVFTHKTNLLLVRDDVQAGVCLYTNESLSTTTTWNFDILLGYVDACIFFPALGEVALATIPQSPKSSPSDPKLLSLTSRISPTACAEARAAITELLSEFLDIFASEGLPPAMNVPKVDLLIDETLPLPASHKKPAYSPDRLTVLAQWEKEAIENGSWSHLPPGMSPKVVHRLQVARKADGSPRVCLDATSGNKVCKRLPTPLLPVLNEAEAVLSNAKVYSSLDFLRGFEALELDLPQALYFCAYGTSGILVPRRLFFGHVNSSQIFQSNVEPALRSCDEGIIVYVDDCIIPQADDSPAGQMKMVETLRRVFLVARQKRFTFKIQKCRFLCQEVELLGRTYSGSGTKVNDSYLHDLLEFPTPSNRSELLSFCGSVQWISRHYRNLAETMAPLTALAGARSKTFEWKPEHDEAFEKTKSCLQNPQILHKFNPSEELLVYVDASALGHGAVLCHRDLETGVPRVVRIYSKKWNKSESRLPAYRRELLALVRACEVFRPYILRANLKVQIYTDHKPLLGIFKSGRLRGSEVVSTLSDLQPVIQINYLRGSSNVMADALSRTLHCDYVTDELIAFQKLGQILPPSLDVRLGRVARSVIEAWPLPNKISTSVSAVFVDVVDQFQEDHESKETACCLLVPCDQVARANANGFSVLVLPLLNQAWVYRLNDNTEVKLEAALAVVPEAPPRPPAPPSIPQDFGLSPEECQRVSWDFTAEKFVVPDDLAAKVISSLHQHLNHVGLTKLQQHIELRCIVNKLPRRILDTITTCECRPSKLGPAKVLTPSLRNTSDVVATGQMWACDIYGPLLDNTFVLTTIDCFSRFLTCDALANRSAASIAEALILLFARRGAPQHLKFDNAKEFTSLVINLLCDAFNTKRLFSLPYFSESNGLIERPHRFMSASFRRIHAASSSDAPAKSFLPMIEFSWNSTVCTSLNVPPFMLELGRIPFFGPAAPTSDIGARIRMLVDEARVFEADYRKTRGGNRDTIPFAPGDSVLLFNPKPNKFDLRWLPGFIVEEVLSDSRVRVRDKGDDQIHLVSASHLLSDLGSLPPLPAREPLIGSVGDLVATIDTDDPSSQKFWLARISRDEAPDDLPDAGTLVEYLSRSTDDPHYLNTYLSGGSYYRYGGKRGKRKPWYGKIAKADVLLAPVLLDPDGKLKAEYVNELAQRGYLPAFLD